DTLPAFFTRSSDFELHASTESIDEIAENLHVKWELGLEGGAVIANPIPEEDALDADYINGMIERAVKEAEEKGIHGKDVTPFLLATVTEATEGKSLIANIALVKNNAKVAAQIAKSLER